MGLFEHVQLRPNQPTRVEETATKKEIRQKWGEIEHPVLGLMGSDGSKYAAELAMRWCKLGAQGLGDYLEFGTYQGKSLTRYFHAAERLGLSSMRFFGFDSFEGLPETKTCPRIDGGRKEAFLAGNYKCGQPELISNLESKGVDLNRVTLVPGFFNESLNDQTKKRLEINSAAVINVDCDLYESTCDVLRFVTGYLRNGTILIFDDFLAYQGHPQKGERRACGEWLSRNPHIQLTEYFKYTHSGVAFIVNLVTPPRRRIGAPTSVSRRKLSSNKSAPKRIG